MFSTHNLLLIQGFLNSSVAAYILNLLNPTLNFLVGDLLKLPVISIDSRKCIDRIEDAISISKQDWNSHETSWDFKYPEIISIYPETYIDNINYQIKEHYRKTGEQICIDPAAPEFDSLKWCYN